MAIVHRIEVETHIHATEDEDKVMEALANLIGHNAVKDVSTVTLRGHYGNAIIVARVQLDHKDYPLDELVRFMASKMSDSDKRILKSSLVNRVQGNKVYLRFDKQKLYLGELMLSDGDDVVRMVLHLNGNMLRQLGLKGALEELGLLNREG